MSYRFLTDVTGNKIALTANSAAIIPLNVKGAVSQTGDLQQWQNNDGSVFAYITSGCNLFAPNATFGTSTFLSSVNLGVTASSASSIPLAVKAATSQTGDLQQWQNSSGTVLSAITSAGNLVVRGTSAQGAFTVYSPSTTSVAAVIRGIASQTADLMQWQNSTGTSMAYVNAKGQLTIGTSAALVNASSITPGLGIITNTAGTPGIIVRSSVSTQSANLTEWQNSSGSVVANVDTFGGARFVYGNFVSDSATTKPLSARGAANQTANIQDWQSSAATSMAYVNAGGQFTIGTSAAIVNASSVTPGLAVITNTAGTPGIIVRGSVSTQSANLMEWQSNTGSVLQAVTSDGTFLNNITTNALANTASNLGYVLVASDAGKNIETVATSVTSTVFIPLNSSVAYPIGTQITFVQTGTASTRIAGTAGVTVNFFSPTSTTIAILKGQWAAATAVKRSTNSWLLVGNLT